MLKSRIDFKAEGSRRRVAGAVTGMLLAMAGLLVACESLVATGPFHYYRVMWSGDASTSATIGFASKSKPGAELKLYYDTVDHGKGISQYAFSKSFDKKSTAFGMNNVFVRLKGLLPATRYYFVVADKNDVGDRYWFETASNNPGDRLSLIAGGDSRNNRQPRQAGNLLVKKLRPHGVLFGGDMVDNGLDLEWKQWFEDWQLTIGDDGKITPVVMTRGNHERSNRILEDLFDTPAGVYYGTAIGGSLLDVITLNTESSIGGAQTDWLKTHLMNNAAVTWKIAQYHRPMRPHVASKAEGNNQYKYWSGLFHQYGVDLVVESDAHTAKATWPLKPSNAPGSSEGFVRDDATGTVYVGEGCWGAPLRDANDNKAWTRDSGKFNHFNWIFVDKARMEVRTVLIDNAEQVGSLTDETRFDMPSRIQIWSPPNGSLITMLK